MAYTILKVRPVFEGWGRFMTAKVRLADGSIADRQIEDHGTSVAILPYDPDRKLATLVRQPRTAALFASGRADMHEAPAGRIEKEERPEEEARREAVEETGLELGELEHVVNAWSSPEVSTERVSLYLARYGAESRAQRGGGLSQEGEALTIVEMPLRDVAAWADSGRLPDMKTLLLVQTLRLRRPDLFA